MLLCLSPVYFIPLLLLTVGAYNELLAAVVVRPIAEKYIAETYPGADLYVDDSGYDFKGNSLYVNIKSATSIDTHFRIWYDLGWPEYKYDNYDNIAEGVNTYNRLEDEYNRLVQAASLDIEHPDSISAYFCEFDPIIQKDGLIKDDLVLDTEFDMLIHGAGYANSCRLVAKPAPVLHCGL